MKTNKYTYPSVFEFIDTENNIGEALASASLNPAFQWAKIVATDNIPNGNNQKVPINEFDNFIKTGRHSPIKMAIGKISDGHEEAYGLPIGTITDLTTEGNKVIALTALWKKERPEDISALKQMYAEGNPPNVSWEISYDYSDIDSDDGSETLHGVQLNGLCVVGMPAYQGRTSFVAMASINNTEEMPVEELEQSKARVAELEILLSEKDTKISDMETELASLRQYKEQAELVASQETKLEEIRTKFQEAGIEKDETYFTEKRETLLQLNEAALDFMIQEMVAFGATASLKNKNLDSKIPNITSIDSNVNVNDPKALAKALREFKNKK
jgi:hypothetical protein